MLYTYASSYISGFGKPVETILKSYVKDLVVIQHLDGLIIYKTQMEFPELPMSCFNNTYQVLAISPTNLKNPYEIALRNFIHQCNIDWAGISHNLKHSKYRSFKILPVDGNSPVSINFDLVKKVEDQIKQELNLSVDIRKHDCDVILSRRSEGLFLLLFKLSYNRTTEKNLNKGELRPELCHILAWISDLQLNDIIIDPFCGHGSIPKEIVKNFKYNMLFASDIDATLISKFKLEFKKNKKGLFIKQRDALNLTYFEDNFFDKIITDPPWNLYHAEKKDFSVFYKKMLAEFYRILKPYGVCTILMGNVCDFEKALDSHKFNLAEKYHILVNGKKANVYKLIKV